ncbi:hypothetical protein EYF80_012892 [Liparis tanakae]|uniref:Uncharacterized protein n=1 Tax=Liparis tanakae TaxID=230148 RepID=A0A4Z2IFL0_9TELE|nr:hypothetical protein EYF80_012892 [Liparis tanakae]
MRFKSFETGTHPPSLLSPVPEVCAGIRFPAVSLLLAASFLPADETRSATDCVASTPPPETLL